MLTEQQRAFRRKGITATDIPAILGFDPNRSGYQVQQEKRGFDNFKDNLYTRAGHALEPVIAQQYCDDNPGGLLLKEGVTAQHSEHPLLLATPDYVVFSGSTGAPIRLLECKAVFAWRSAEQWGPPETDRIPQHFFVQVQWQLGVLRLTEADVARFYGGEVRYWRVAFDAATFAELRDYAALWWDRHIVRGVDLPPQSIDLEAVERAQRPIEREEVDAATQEEGQLLAKWRSLFRQHKELESELDGMQARVIQAIGGRRGIESMDGDQRIKVTYDNVKSKETTDWLALARELGATPDDVMRHTRRPPSYRRIWCSFWNERKK